MPINQQSGFSTNSISQPNWSHSVHNNNSNPFHSIPSLPSSLPTSSTTQTSSLSEPTSVFLKPEAPFVPVSPQPKLLNFTGSKSLFASTAFSTNPFGTPIPSRTMPSKMINQMESRENLLSSTPSLSKPTSTSASISHPKNSSLTLPTTFSSKPSIFPSSPNQDNSQSPPKDSSSEKKYFTCIWLGSSIVVDVGEKNVLKNAARQLLTDPSRTITEAIPVDISIDTSGLHLSCSNPVGVSLGTDLLTIKIEHISACFMLRENPRIISLGVIDPQITTKALVFGFFDLKDAEAFMDTVREAFMAKIQSSSGHSEMSSQDDSLSSSHVSNGRRSNFSSPKSLNHTQSDQYAGDSLLLPTTAGLYSNNHSSHFTEASLLDCYY